MRNIKKILKKIEKHSEVGFRKTTVLSPPQRWYLNKLTDQYLEQLSTIKDRISDILTVANYGLDHGMRLTEVFMIESYKDGMLFSTTVKHQMGLIVCPLDEKLYLGFNRDMSEIPTDFMTNGEEAFEYNRYTHRKEKADYYSLSHFFKVFDKFEEEFYQYIEKECDYYEPEADEEALTKYYFEGGREALFKEIEDEEFEEEE